MMTEDEEDETFIVIIVVDRNRWPINYSDFFLNFHFSSGYTQFMWVKYWTKNQINQPVCLFVYLLCAWRSSSSSLLFRFFFYFTSFMIHDSLIIIITFHFISLSLSSLQFSSFESIRRTVNNNDNDDDDYYYPLLPPPKKHTHIYET